MEYTNLEVPTQEIPQDTWAAHLNGIGKTYRGWRTRVEVIGPELGDQTILDNQPLRGLHVETEARGAGDIVIELGEAPQVLIHHIDRPTGVRIADTVPGQQVYIQVESEDGLVTLIRLERLHELPSGHGMSEQPHALHRQYRLATRGIGHRARGTTGAIMLVAMLGAGLLLLWRPHPRRNNRARGYFPGPVMM
jgi:hypothetical protein